MAEESETTLRDFCIQKPWCRLCWFRVQDGESVVAIYESDRASAPFLFQEDEVHKDESIKIEFHMCCAFRCMRNGLPTPCLHSSCYALRYIPMTRNFFTVTQYDFSPSIRTERRRGHRLEHAVAKRLKIDFLRYLPHDICLLVASYITSDLAAVACQEFAQGAHSSNSTVDLCRDVYATYIVVEGISYLQSLSNSPPDSVGESKFVYSAQQEHEVRKLYVEYDHLGVRNIHFSFPNDHLPSLSGSSRGVWWKELARSSGIARIVTHCDGRKVRRILDATDNPVPGGNDWDLKTGWPTPGKDRRLIYLDNWEISQIAISHLRMVSVDCNTPATNGYTAVIHGMRPPRIYAHTSDTPSRFYEGQDGFDDPTGWLYMPIDEGEHLMEIWAVKIPGDGLAALMFCTNKGRAAMFGLYLLSPDIRVELLRLWYAPTSTPSQIYFADWEPLHCSRWIKLLGVDSTAYQIETYKTGGQEETWKPYPPTLMSSSPPPYTTYNEFWYYTSCRLEDAAEIIYCTKATAAHKPIIGILIRYRDGRRSCVGSYRQDWALDRIVIDPSRSLRVVLGRTPKNWVYVADIYLQTPAMGNPDSPSWIDMPWSGRLEWWFSRRHSKLIHSD